MYQIRRAEPGDAEGIVAVATQVWHATYEGILPRTVQDQALAAWYPVERIRQQSMNQKAALMVALAEGGEVVGFAHLIRRPEAGEAELTRFYVLPAHQGRGIGRQLVAAAVSALRNDGPVERLRAQVERENQLGLAAYAAMGFAAGRTYPAELFGHTTEMVEVSLTLPQAEGTSSGEG